jgi:hypothetical protein
MGAPLYGQVTKLGQPLGKNGDPTDYWHSASGFTLERRVPAMR